MKNTQNQLTKSLFMSLSLGWIASPFLPDTCRHSRSVLFKILRRDECPTESFPQWEYRTKTASAIKWDISLFVHVFKLIILKCIVGAVLLQESDRGQCWAALYSCDENTFVRWSQQHRVQDSLLHKCAQTHAADSLSVQLIGQKKNQKKPTGSLL